MGLDAISIASSFLFGRRRKMREDRLRQKKKLFPHDERQAFRADFQQPLRTVTVRKPINWNKKGDEGARMARRNAAPMRMSAVTIVSLNPKGTHWFPIALHYKARSFYCTAHVTHFHPLALWERVRVRGF